MSGCDTNIVGTLNMVEQENKVTIDKNFKLNKIIAIEGRLILTWVGINLSNFHSHNHFG